MATFVSNRDSGSLTNEEGHFRLQTNVWLGNVLTGFVVSQNSTPAMSVFVSAGDIRIPYANYAYTAWSDSVATVAVNTADTVNPRIDRVVAYIDRSLSFTDSDTNNPGALKFKVVAGTPAAIPVKPSDSAVNTSVGASNPWVEIATLTVAANATQVLNAHITDTRTMLTAFANSIDNDALQENAVGTENIQAGAVGSTQLGTSSVTSTKYDDESITSDKLALTTATATVTTSQATTSGTFTNLTTVGPSITINVGQSGVVLLTWTCRINATATVDSSGVVSYTASGANTIAAADSNGIAGGQYSQAKGVTCTRLLTGLTPGSTTFRMVYRTFGGSASVSFQNRIISAVAL